MNKRTFHLVVLLWLTWFSAFSQGTAFTYQGRLIDSSGPANGNYDLRFILYTADAGGSQMGPIVTYTNQNISDGLFTAELNFGDVFDGTDRWLEIAVRTSGSGTFTTLSPRQLLRPTPYAVRAATATDVANGAVNNPSFIGTTSGAPLEFFADNQRALRLEPGGGSNHEPNVIGGFAGNSVAPGVFGAVIAGGGGTNTGPVGIDFRNTVEGDFSTISGGGSHLIRSNATYSVISGGNGNLIDEDAYGATIAGGVASEIMAGSRFATIAGGFANVASGQSSFAAGQSAQALHDGSFVWADDAPFYASFSSVTTNEFAIRAQNGVRIQSDKGIHLNAADRPLIVRDWDVFATNAPAGKAGIGRWGLFMEPSYLTIGIPSDTDVPGRYFQVAKYAKDGTATQLLRVDQSGNLFTSGAINPPSDRNAKEHFTAINSHEILDEVASLPISLWSYKADPSVRHLGPVAQDFSAAFHVGADDKHIATVDADGVALAAIKGLNEKVDSENAELREALKQKETEVTELKQRLRRLEALVAHKPGAGAM